MVVKAALGSGRVNKQLALRLPPLHPLAPRSPTWGGSISKWAAGEHRSGSGRPTIQPESTPCTSHSSQTHRINPFPLTPTNRRCVLLVWQPAPATVAETVAQLVKASDL